MWSEVLSGAAGAVLGGAGIELWHRKGRRAVGHVTRDTGLDAYISTDFGTVWAGAPAGWITQYAFFPEGLPDETPPRARQQWNDWVSQNGGLLMGSQTVTVHLIGRSPSTVIVKAPEVEVLESWDLASGDAAIWMAAGGASIIPNGYTVDLDELGPQDPVVKIIHPSGNVYEPKPRSYSLAPNEAERFDIDVVSKVPRGYRWRVRLPVLVDGRSEFLDPHPAREPYLEFAGGAPESFYSWDESASEWQEMERWW